MMSTECECCGGHIMVVGRIKKRRVPDSPNDRVRYLCAGCDPALEKSRKIIREIRIMSCSPMAKFGSGKMSIDVVFTNGGPKRE